MGIKAILRRLFPAEERRLPPEPVRGDVIRCYDCHRLGYIAYHPDGTYTMDRGWRMARIGLYICPKCGEKRRRAVLQMMKEK